MTGTTDLLQRCFAGIELREDTLWLNPFWPKSLGKLEFSIFYRDQLVTLSIVDHTVRISGGPGSYPSIRVGCRGQLRDLRPGQSLAFPL
jgi:trehalose/maltose hydrolase-like predicted phosphorylase